MNCNHTFTLFIIGMAGSGKSTLVNNLSKEFSNNNHKNFIINLDPASKNLNYIPNIDIRDTVDYKKVMRIYNLGPNGAIMASLNLFSTRFDQIQKIIKKNSSKIEFIIIDTPGQLEVFTWSASGSIITECFLSNSPVLILYVIDLSKILNPINFTTNILYSCSTLYKTKIPSLTLVNKIDITSIDFFIEWYCDSNNLDTSFQENGLFIESFRRSLSLVLDSFNQKIIYIGISSLKNIGLTKINNYINKLKLEFEFFFQKELEKSVKKNFKDLICKNKIDRKLVAHKRNSFNINSNLLSEKKEYYLILEYLLHLKYEKDLVKDLNFVAIESV
ncbi:ATP(GTP)-binding protein (nucleomorph) [Guillardia theta]|uniref:GPN-loop GTPase n=1 Tax=Guillardia theta TaxID=55529 RepID=Q98RU6_GUITH|nr:ATP(GTP)-binding protein [Guillardia theta]AAK39853.1 ATP(GTP)-binding protein [Guillardia theta]